MTYAGDERGRRERGRGYDALRFLDEHRLPHSPSNFSFALDYLFGADQALKSAVRAIIDGGVRISPAEVQRLSYGEANPPLAVVGSEIDQITWRVLHIVRNTMQATGSLNKDLVAASVSLLATDVVNVRQVVASLVERTALAERTLAEATEQAQRVRRELDALRSEVDRDALTSLLNRSGLEAHVELLRDESFCLALVDVDRLSRINETHGHCVGDRLLRLIGVALSEACAPHLVARWDGQQFMVLMEGCQVDSAFEIVDRAREAIAAMQLRVRENDQPLGTVTMSAGVVTRRGRSRSEMVDAAQAMLSTAKNQGANLVIAERRLVGVD